jgi:23S rRNA (uracil1939-C5)-methyltransferase
LTEDVTIAAMGQKGDGIAETSAGRVAVAYALPGERVRVERAGERARLLEVLESSDGRVAPICRHFGVCGGCATQHWALARYFEWKRDLVLAALARARVPAPVAEIVDAHGAGRRRAVFHAASGGKPFAAGFMARRSHDIVPIEECPVLVPALERALPVMRRIATLVRPTAKPLDLHFTAADNGLDADLRGVGKLGPKLEAALVTLAVQSKLLRITRHGAPLAQLAEPALKVGTANVMLPPGTFLQATAAGEAALAALVLEAANGAKHAADLFSGIGTFALRLAAFVPVSAFDMDAGAIAALARAANAQGLKPVQAERRDLFRWPLTADELKRFDFVVLDPPRQGAEAQVRVLAASRVKRIAYVSCDADTFARDAATLIAGGYKLKAVTPVDQFRYSPHVELVGVFSK